MGLVLDLDLLLADVLLDDLDVFDDLLAYPDLLLHHGPLLHHDLFLHDRNDDLFLHDLGRGGVSPGGSAFFHGYALHSYLGALSGDLDPLPLGTHALADPHRPRLALAPADRDLLLRTPYADLVIIAAGYVR